MYNLVIEISNRKHSLRTGEDMDLDPDDRIRIEGAETAEHFKSIKWITGNWPDYLLGMVCY